MIPRQGRRFAVNEQAVFHPVVPTQPEEGGSVPTLIVGGVRVSAYVDGDGAFRVSIATDEDDLAPEIRHTADGVSMGIVVNSETVFRI